MAKDRFQWIRKVFDAMCSVHQPTEQEVRAFDRYRKLCEVLPSRGGQFGDFLADKDAEVIAGTFGLVYKVRRINKPGSSFSALKILRPDLIDDPVAYERFMRETKILEVIRHPNIVRCLSEGTIYGIPFMELEYLAGQTLAHHVVGVDGLRPPTPRKIVEIVRDLCDPVEASHARGIVHRDIKPSNVFLDTGGAEERVVLFSFGFGSVPPDFPARPSAGGSLVGTIGFMSPEQARREPAQATDDLFSLGAIIYRSVYGHSVYGRDEEDRILSKSRAGWVNRPPPGQPKPLEDLIAQATAAEAKDRFQSAVEFKTALNKVLQHLPM